MQPVRKPFLPSDINHTRSYWRGVTARAVGFVNGQDPSKTVARMWPSDEGAAIVTRASVNPADRATTGWAAEFAGNVVGPFLSGIAVKSAAARLFQECLRLELSGHNAALLPAMTTFPTSSFVAEGAPIPAVQGVFANVTLGPVRKLALITGMTEELAKHSAESAEAIIRTAIAEAAAKTLDQYVFDNVAASTSRPAGLLNGVTPLTPTAGGGQAACITDIKNLVAAIVTAGGGSNIQFFANPAQAVVFAAFFPFSKLPMIPTSALAANTVAAIEVDAIASGFSGAPDITTSREALVHWDTSPQPIGTPGSPNVVAAVTRSAFQQAELLLKMIVRCAWIARAPGMVQVVNSTTW
jgi:hypothetical protein